MYFLMIFLGAGMILLPGIPLISIMFYSQVINGTLLPFVLIAMLLLINDRRIMGRYTNGPVMNTIAWLTVFILIFISGAMVVSSLI
jgi:Mn2+/Fe2+ NRAMP family transporter